MKKIEEIKEEYIWEDKRRPLWGLPLSFTKYRLTTEKLLINTGVFSLTQEEVRLYRIMDVTVKCSFFQRLFHVGTIHCCTADKSTPEFEIRDVKNAIRVKDLISKNVEEERDRKKISSRELMHTEFDDNDDIYN